MSSPVASRLPPYGWTAHSEQIDEASYEARVWSITTKLASGYVVRTNIARNDPTEQERQSIEKLAAHAKSCKTPGCTAGEEMLKLVDEHGKYNNGPAFLTLAIDPRGIPVFGAMQTATTREEAIDNHLTLVGLTVSSIVAGLWGRDAQRGLA